MVLTVIVSVGSMISVVERYVKGDGFAVIVSVHSVLSVVERFLKDDCSDCHRLGALGDLGG
jgi:hypothetical protein